jgi:dihydroflavonol-4-reductase
MIAHNKTRPEVPRERSVKAVDHRARKPLERGSLVAVTGATGLVGNNVVRLLLARGFRVRALVRPRLTGVDRSLAGLPVEIAEGRVGDPAFLRRSCEAASLVVHSAGMVHIGRRHADEMWRVNVEGTRNVARAAFEAGAQMVHVSSVDAIGLRADGLPADEDTPPGGLHECPYVTTKRESETVVLAEVARGLDAVIVNPVYMLGPWDWKPSSGRMLLEVASGKGAFAPPGSNDFVDVRDVAAGILLAATRGRSGRRYILGGHRLSYLEAWRLFAEVSGRMPPLALAPPVAVRVAGWFGDVAGMFMKREPDLNSAAAASSLLPHNFSSQRAQTELGYHFRPFETTVEDAFDWFVEHGYAHPARSRTAVAR